METTNEWCIFDGQLVAEDERVVPITSRGLMYGDGIFETFRSYNGQTLSLSEHLARLNAGAEILGIKIPTDLETDELKFHIRQLLNKKELLDQDAIIRIQLWRDGQRGYAPTENVESHFSIMATACPDRFRYSKLVTVNKKRIPAEAMPSAYKFTNGINYILASQEARNQNGDDALMQTIDGKISETTTGNIFWVRKPHIFTPSTDCDLLPGIIRQIVLELIGKNKKWQLEEGKYSLDHILEADAVFITNSVRELLPVQQVNERSFNTENNVLTDLKHLFRRFRDANLESL